jgi:cytochrome c2
MTKIQTVVAEATLADQLAALGKKAGQLAFEAVVKDHSITELTNIGAAGEHLTGSAERAIGALFNYKLADAMAADEDRRHWSEVIFGSGVKDTTDLAKAIVPLRKEFFDARREHSNASTVFKRVKTYSFDLTNPKITAPIGEGAEGEGAGGAGGTPSRTRDLYARYVVELGKLYRAGMSAENDAIIKNHPRGAEIVAALESVTAALKALGAPLDDEELKTFMAAQR